MTETTIHADPYAEQSVVQAARARGEPDWLVERRAAGARAFAATAMPTPALRLWKYTDVTALDLAAFPPADAAVTVRAETPAGAFAGPMAEALTEALTGRDEIVRAQLDSLVTATEGKFSAANAAQWSQGVLVHAPAGTVFERAVVITIESDAADATAIFPRLCIVAEERADVTVIVRYRSGGQPLLVPGVVEVVAGPASRVRLVFDGRWGPATQEFTTIRSRLARDAEVQISSIVIGGRLVKQTIEALMEGEGARSVIRAVALGDGEQHFDFVTLQDHIGPRTTSDVEIKAALAGASRSVYYGITRVEETAAGAQASQQNRNLLLSEHAKADSDPVLEILTADVIRCGHAATVGPVDAEAMFYLQSRGLERRASLQLLVSGFFQSVADAVPLSGAGDEADDDSYETLHDAVIRKLATAEL